MNQSRAQVFAAIICTAIDAKSVLLSAIVARLPGGAKQKSKFRRIQDFYAEVQLNYNAVALFIVWLLDKLLLVKWTLAIDRTNWTLRQTEVNLLTLSVCLGDVAVPLFWQDLGYRGNSNTRQRIKLLERFVELFGHEKIDCLLGDREFVGGKWFEWLIKRKIPFVMRIKDNFTTAIRGGRETAVKNCFRNLKLHESRELGLRKICGCWLLLSAVRLPGNEFVILVSFNLSDILATELYWRRWNIETGFEKLKSHGFNLEDSRLQGTRKTEMLMAALSLSMAWCYAVGEWSAREVEPIKLKSHGRKERSIFGRGLDELMSLFSGSSRMLRRLSQVCFGFIRRVEIEFI